MAVVWKIYREMYINVIIAMDFISAKNAILPKEMISKL